MRSFSVFVALVDADRQPYFGQGTVRTDTVAAAFEAIMDSVHDSAREAGRRGPYQVRALSITEANQ